MATISPSGQLSRLSVLDCLITGALFYYLKSLLPILGIIVGDELVTPPSGNPMAVKSDVIGRFANWDGWWYKQIVTEGYTQKPGEPANTIFAFFPGYPLLGSWVAHMTGMRLEWAFLLVAHATLLGTFVLTIAYVRRRYPADSSRALAEFVLLALGLIPSGCFFRFTYTESLFVFLLVLGLYGMERRWPLVLLAVIVGSTSAVRAVGVAFIPAFLLHVWGRVPHTRRGVAWATLLMPLACWGITAYMLFQFIQFGDPLLFLKAETAVTHRPNDTWTTKLQSDLTLATVWRVFDPDSPGYWDRTDIMHNPLFSLAFADPIYFVAAAIVLGIGIRKRWLNRVEATLACLLLLIPYFSKGYDIYMAGTARFVSAIFPLYLVLGHLLVGLPPPLATVFLVICSFFLALYSALFAVQYYIV